MYSRPEKPLIVKCTFDRWHKKITFSSARNCSFDLLRRKVEQCFSLYATSYAIAYKDDDGEITNITTEADLTEAIQYFQAGNDDQPLSSAASILSGRSFGARKVTLHVNISVDYDGPSLSDTSSLVSLEEYKGRNGSQQSFSFSSPSVDMDDDSVTVSSRDNGAGSAADFGLSNGSDPFRLSTSGQSASSKLSSHVSNAPSWAASHEANGTPHMIAQTVQSHSVSSMDTTSQQGDPFADTYHVSDANHYPQNPSAVLEQLKLEEEMRDNGSSIDYDSLSGDARGAAWLRDQNERTIRSMLGALPEPSISDRASSHGRQRQRHVGGDLALQRDPRGKYYYTYTSAGSSISQLQDSGYDNDPATSEKPRPTSMHLSWLAAQQINPDNRRPRPSHSVPSLHTHVSDPLPSREHYLPSAGASSSAVDRELLPFLPFSAPPSASLTDCSECGVLLDAIRYVCSTCGEKPPVGDTKYKGGHVYPPRSATSSSESSRTYVGSSDSFFNRHLHLHKPLPSLPYGSGSTLSIPGTTTSTGYELCSGCLESAGVNHAIEAGLAPGSSPGLGNSSPSSPEDAQRASQWRRSAPKKGQLRHAYQEKVWGHGGWEDVEQDESQISKCSTCETAVLRKRYKCVSCTNINLCRACYSQVHELHPSHSFLVVQDKPLRSHSEPDYHPANPPDPNDEQSLTHPGVKCAHCLLDIVGARFHCAICDSVDICSNCESAGLPGNLDSSDGGHNSSHILIKIPYPLELPELQNASRRAKHLWTGRDSANVGPNPPRSKASSVISTYARTVVGSRHHLALSSDDHQISCNSCNRTIIGIRYQCAHCPSLPTAYNLCSSCEELSYVVHDPMHTFFKLPRPVQRPIEASFSMLPLLYKIPAGSSGVTTPNDPKGYLKNLVHASALCDRCMTRIEGEWFRCAYCARDLCDVCEEVDTHDDCHIFIVFKSTVDMQAFRAFTNIENPSGSPPVIPYPVYR